MEVLAAGLLSTGLKPNDRILVCGSNHSHVGFFSFNLKTNFSIKHLQILILEFLGNDLRASCCKSGARLFSGQPKLRLC